MILFVAAGGALGSVARHMVVNSVGQSMGTQFPFGVLTVNILGSFILGVLVETMALKWQVSQEVRAFMVVGVMGGFTTFSSFSLDTILQLERGNLAGAGVYVLSSVTFSVLGLFAGLRLARHVLA
jgi:CrcB protein